MKTSEFWFELPPERIAQFPPEERGGGRLLLLERDTGKREHRLVDALPEILAEDLSANGAPLLVFNNSRVRKARLSGRSCGSGAVSEFLLVNRVDPRTWRVLVGKAKRKKPGSRYVFAGGLEAEIVECADEGGSGDIHVDPKRSAFWSDAAGRHPCRPGCALGGSGRPPPAGWSEGGPGGSGGCAPLTVRKQAPLLSGFRYLRFDAPIDDDWLDAHGRVPLPPYIARPDDAADAGRYQTVYADRNAGAALGPGASAAAPTAGLHFTGEMFERLERAGAETAFVTLHVGLGTFLPVRAENVEDHVMHEEAYSIGKEAARRINRAKAAGRTVVAVGTTSLRTLESAWRPGAEGIAAGEGATSIFIVPGYRFRIADALFTNFHTPCSTLLMLVSAFAGRELILDSYACAIREGYRFFSYGDAMLIY